MLQESARGHILLLLEREQEARHSDAAEIDESHLQRRERVRCLQQYEDDREQAGIDRLCQIEGADPLDVGYDRLSFLHDILHRREVGIHEHNVGGLLCGL